MFPQAGGEEAEGRAGQSTPDGVDKHTKPLVDTVLLVENPSTRGFTRLSGQLSKSRRRLERLTVEVVIAVQSERSYDVGWVL